MTNSNSSADFHPSDSALSLYYDGDGAEEFRASLKSHIEGCSQCQEKLKDLAALSAKLQSISTLRAPSDLFTGLKQRIEEDIATREQLLQDQFTPATPGPRRGLGAWSNAIAALFLIGFVYLVYQSYEQFRLNSTIQDQQARIDQNPLSNPSENDPAEDNKKAAKYSQSSDDEAFLLKKEHELKASKESSGELSEKSSTLIDQSNQEVDDAKSKMARVGDLGSPRSGQFSKTEAQRKAVQQLKEQDKPKSKGNDFWEKGNGLAEASKPGSKSVDGAKAMQLQKKAMPSEAVTKPRAKSDNKSHFVKGNETAGPSVGQTNPVKPLLGVNLSASQRAWLAEWTEKLPLPNTRFLFYSPKGAVEAEALQPSLGQALSLPATQLPNICYQLDHPSNEVSWKKLELFVLAALSPANSPEQSDSSTGYINPKLPRELSKSKGRKSSASPPKSLILVDRSALSQQAHLRVEIKASEVRSLERALQIFLTSSEMGLATQDFAATVNNRKLGPSLYWSFQPQALPSLEQKDRLLQIYIIFSQK